MNYKSFLEEKKKKKPKQLPKKKKKKKVVASGVWDQMVTKTGGDNKREKRMIWGEKKNRS